MAEYCYAVRDKRTGDFSRKYESNKFYIRQGDAVKKAKKLNAWQAQHIKHYEDFPDRINPKVKYDFTPNPYEVVRAELNWEAIGN